MIERLCVIGVGLIGGSVARAARERKLCREIIAVDSNSDNLRSALDSGTINQGFSRVDRDASSADLVILCVPVGETRTVLQQLNPFWSDARIYTDTGSTKLNVIEAANEVFGGMPENLVPGHPIAGSERSGFDAADAALFSDKRVILTPLDSTCKRAYQQVTGFWQEIGAVVTTMDPQHHDEVLAATSHLPHLLSFALVHMLGQKDANGEIFRYAAGGFKDFTRIASSDPRMWRDICLANRDNIHELLSEFRNLLDRIDGTLDSGDVDALYEMFSSAGRARQKFLDEYNRNR